MLFTELQGKINQLELIFTFHSQYKKNKMSLGPLKQAAFEQFTLPRKWDQDLTIKCSDGVVCCSRVDLIRHSGYFRKRFEFELNADVVTSDEIEEKETTMKPMLIILPIITPGENQKEYINTLNSDKESNEIANYYDVPLIHTRIKDEMELFFNDREHFVYEKQIPFFLSFDWYRPQVECYKRLQTLTESMPEIKIEE
jgi:hypothetical protein